MPIIALPSDFLPSLFTYAGILIVALLLTRIYVQRRMNLDLTMQAEIDAAIREEAALDARRTPAERAEVVADERRARRRLTLMVSLFVAAAVASIYLASR